MPTTWGSRGSRRSIPTRPGGWRSTRPRRSAMRCRWRRCASFGRRPGSCWASPIRVPRRRRCRRPGAVSSRRASCRTRRRCGWFSGRSLRRGGRGGSTRGSSWPRRTRSRPRGGFRRRGRRVAAPAVARPADGAGAAAAVHHRGGAGGGRGAGGRTGGGAAGALLPSAARGDALQLALTLDRRGGSGRRRLGISGPRAGRAGMAGDRGKD